MSSLWFFYCFFFFKQKTAYEMRISDWSSDVCSSDLRASGSDDASRIAPRTLMTLEECMEYIQQDECIEVTPKSIRLRKNILNEEIGRASCRERVCQYV